MTDLEMWTFCCIVSVFVSLVSYGIILVKDQMIIQVVKVRVGICKCFWNFYLCLLCDMVFVESNWANFFLALNHKYRLCPNTRSDWDIGYGVIISSNEIEVNMNFVQIVSMNLLREWLWTMRAMLLNFLRGMRGRFGVQRRRRWLVFFFSAVGFLFVSKLWKPDNNDDITLYDWDDS